jgi:hypothetical protein
MPVRHPAFQRARAGLIRIEYASGASPDWATVGLDLLGDGFPMPPARLGTRPARPAGRCQVADMFRALALVEVAWGRVFSGPQEDGGLGRRGKSHLLGNSRQSWPESALRMAYGAPVSPCEIGGTPASQPRGDGGGEETEQSPVGRSMPRCGPPPHTYQPDPGRQCGLLEAGAVTGRACQRADRARAQLIAAVPGR